MAPTRTRPQATVAGAAKKVHRKTRTQREPSDSWELLEHQGLNSHADDEEMEDQHHDLVIQVPVDVDEAMNPLREMAERVGKEVEVFAQELDEFFVNLHAAHHSRFDAAHDLVLRFKKIAVEAVEHLKKSHEREMREQLRKEWSEQAPVPAASTGLAPFTSTGSSSLTAKKAGQVGQLRRWQQEADIWELFRIMLELHPFEADAEIRRVDKERELAKLGTPHRYTSESDLWLRFLAEDDLAKERSMIKTWLEQTADHQSSDVPSIIEELEAKAGRGKGLWSSGWMHTRERIKGEKRLRSWPNATDSPLPQIRRSDNNELLVTTLDPDAPRRQIRTLEKPDSYFERSMWVACWEMFRRGKSIGEIADWCEERKEGWRGLIVGEASELVESATSMAAFRQMCLLASQSGCSSDHEAAVLGLIGGNVKAMDKVSYTIDDHLYAYYSAALTRQFEQYLLAVGPNQVRPTTGSRTFADDSLLDPERAQEAISELIIRLRKNTSTSTESAQPMKIIQSFLLADEVGSLIHTVGAAIAEAASLQGPEDMIFLRDRIAPESGKPRGEIEVALDMQTLRIVTHMAIIHRILSPEYLEGDELLEDENVLVSYIQALRKAGKRLLVPGYAAKLQRQRYIIVLGRVLQDITKEDEQNEMLRLLVRTNLDIVPILQEQLAWILDTSFSPGYAEKPLTMLEPAQDTKLHPGQRMINNFLPDEITPSDEAVVSSLQWFQLLPGGWDVVFGAFTVALRRCLVTGRLTCARMIVANFSYENLSLRKSSELIGRSVNIMDDIAAAPNDEEEAMTIAIMKRQSRTYYELEVLVRAIEVLASWRAEEFEYVEQNQKPSSIPPALKRCKKDVSEAMAPLLRGILQRPVDEAEAEDLAHIRLTYLPEVILAYNAVLHAAGNLITREALLESMDLSVAIANTSPNENGDDGEKEFEEGEAREGNGLADLFIRAGRMRELVSAFALTSKAMLVLKAEGRPWKPKKERVGKDLGMWEIGSGRARMD